MTLILDNVPAVGSGALPALSPSQKAAYELSLATIPGSPVTVLKGEVGMGKSLIVAHLQAQLGGTIHSLDRVMAEIVKREGGKIEEKLVDFVTSALAHDDLVFFEDITMLDQLGSGGSVERPLYLHHVMETVYERIAAAGKRLVISTSDWLNPNNATKAAVIELAELGMDDFLAILRNRFSELPADFDSDKLSRTHKKLTAYQIVAGANTLKNKGINRPSADDVIEVMDAVKARSNLIVEDVEDVTFEGLVGVGPIVREMLRTIVIPMTQPGLARELGLKPARGVLLHGEPGTGKTTIGRALARQMKGKFFIMDGSVTPRDADTLLEAAETNSPSVLFIDDADVIFKHGENSGFARKLLTKLDGMESRTIGNVCIIMTAMNVADMPPAIVRSGRVEVWLHMELPDARKRTDIIRHYAKLLPPALRGFDETKLVDATSGFSPADLRGLVGDARGHIAFDRHKGRTVRSFEDYLLGAAHEIRYRKDVLADLGGKPRGGPRMQISMPVMEPQPM